MDEKKFFELSTGKRRAFLVKKAQSDKSYSVVIEFLANNPGIYDDLKGLSARLGLDAKNIEPAVRDMITAGILKTAKIRNWEVLYLSENKEIISDFIDTVDTLKKDTN